jgi:hypothetical protein
MADIINYQERGFYSKMRSVIGTVASSFKDGLGWLVSHVPDSNFEDPFNMPNHYAEELRKELRSESDRIQRTATRKVKLI